MRTRLALLAAIVLGIVAAVGVKHYLTRKDIEYEKKGVRVGIAVAREKLKAGDVLRDGAIARKEVDKAAVTDMHILYDQRKNWLGQKLTRQIGTGQAVLATYFVRQPESEEFTRRKIRRRWRAMTIGTDQIAGVAGLITPGSRVDLLGTFRDRGVGPSAEQTVVTRVLARNVEVLAVDNRSNLRLAAARGRLGAMDQGYSSVTLHVNPLEAALLTYAQATGKITFVLRHGDETTSGEDDVEPVTHQMFLELLHRAEQRRIRDAKAEQTP
jgi:pilus assembly protein CpaB